MTSDAAARIQSSEAKASGTGGVQSGGFASRAQVGERQAAAPASAAAGRGSAWRCAVATHTCSQHTRRLRVGSMSRAGF